MLLLLQKSNCHLSFFLLLTSSHFFSSQPSSRVLIEPQGEGRKFLLVKKKMGKCVCVEMESFSSVSKGPRMASANIFVFTGWAKSMCREPEWDIQRPNPAHFKREVQYLHSGQRPVPSGAEIAKLFAFSRRTSNVFLEFQRQLKQLTCLETAKQCGGYMLDYKMYIM